MAMQLARNAFRPAARTPSNFILLNNDLLTEICKFLVGNNYKSVHSMRLTRTRLFYGSIGKIGRAHV